MMTMTTNKTTLEQLLTHCIRSNVPARVVPVVGKSGKMEFYIHADGADSTTLDFQVSNNELKPLERAAGG